MRRVIAVAALVVLMAGAGATAAVAVWTATVSKSAAVTNASVATSSNGLASLAINYKAGLSGVFAPALVRTAPVTVSNTGTAPLVYTLTTAGGNATLNAAISLQAWKSDTSCDATTVAPGTATTGTLAVPPTLSADANSAIAGGTLTLCLRTAISAAQHAASIGVSTLPTVTVTGQVGSNWTATSTGSFTQTASYNWLHLVHKFSGKCMDANGGTASANTTLILYPCKALVTGDNQAFRFEAIGAFYRIYIGAGTAANPIVKAPAITGGQVTLQNIDTSTITANLEQWTIVAHGTAGDFQIKNRNGACLAMTASADLTVFVTATCTTSVTTTDTAYRAQHFNLVEIP